VLNPSAHLEQADVTNPTGNILIGFTIDSRFAVRPEIRP
jgi:hypothetical protein